MSGSSKRFVAIAIFTAVLIVLVNLAWWLSYQRTERLLEDQLDRRLHALATTAAASLDSETLSGLLFGDPEAYLETIDLLESVRRADSLAEAFIIDDNYRYLATTALEPDSVYFLSALNAPYIDSILFGQAAGAVATATYQTGSVRLKSVFAPLYDADRVVLGVLGLEASVDYFDALTELRTNLYYSSALSLLGGVVLGLLFLGLQRRINQAERKLFLAETETYLGRMVSVVAHELKNPMMIIRGSAERLARKTEAEESKYIVEEIDRLNQIVSGYLEFAGTKGSIVASEAPVSIDTAELVGSLRKHLSEKYAETSIEWLGEIPEPSPAFTGYARSLRQVLLNLLINGVEACQSAGKPVAVGIEVRERGGRIELTVVDRGPGMTTAMRKKSFDPFYTTKQTGSGLGLYVSRRIVDDMGGSLEITSSEGSGSRMIVRLPKQPT
ncbi:hypothetical protein GF420_04580 [candidate division GN15 bacterium]|nr:hypothetical protein [candidate division GN15 bacterium]